jgi:predicted RNase H-like nuclease (RuvC/YqgF family)
MVKSCSRPRKATKFVVDLGPEIDKVVKKKNAKIKKQKVVIADLREQLRNRPDDMKVKKQKFVITSLQTTVNELTTKLKEVEDEMRTYKVKCVDIKNKTLEYAFKRLREGYSLSRMKPNTRLLIQQSGRWNEALKLHTQNRLC